MAGMGTVVYRSCYPHLSLLHAPMHQCTLLSDTTKTPRTGIKWWAVPRLLHTLNILHTLQSPSPSLPIAQFCLAAIITPTPLRLHDPHCLTARLESFTLHILFLRARLPTSVPNLLIHLATPHLDLGLLIYISDITRRVYSCPSLCHWRSRPPARSSSVHYNESHTSINALTCVAI